MLAWKEGQPYSDRFGDVYFSADSGLEETRHVFLQGNRLKGRFAPPGASLDFFSVEKFPLSDDELRAALALWTELSAQAEVLLARWHRRVLGTTPLVGEVAPPTRYWRSQPIAGGGAMQSLPHQRTPSHRVATAPGLYCSLAHGTRGLLTAGIAAEVIATAMCGQLPPLPQSLLDALAPLPRMRNKRQCAT